MMFRHIYVELWQLWVIIPNVKPLVFLILVEINQLVIKVQAVYLLAHLDSSSTDHYRVVLIRPATSLKQHLK